MIDKELSELKKDLPEYNIDNYKSGIYTKYNNKKNTRKIYFPKIAFVSIVLIMFISIIGLSTYAIKVEAQEYQNAVDFFEANELSLAGLTRYEIKEIYKDITTKKFDYKKTGEVIVESIESKVPGYSIEIDNASSSNLISVWELWDSLRKQDENPITGVYEEIKDIELLSFYNETMVINSVDGFPYIVTTDDLHTSQQLTRVHERYNEEFFEHYALMIISFDTCLTEEIIGINDIKFDGEKFIAIFDVSGVPITDDISTRHFVFKINKLAFQNMDKPSYQVDIKANNLENMGNGSAYYDAYFTPDGDVVNKTSLPHEMPDDFSFTITFGFDGYYDSKTGVLKNGYNYDLSCECKTTLKFSEEELKEIYGIFLECSIDRWDEELTVNDNLVKPSYIIDISFTANTETINIRIFGASFIGLNEWNNSVKLGEAYYKIVNEYIKTSEEFQSLPKNQKYYY